MRTSLLSPAMIADAASSPSPPENSSKSGRMKLKNSGGGGGGRGRRAAENSKNDRDDDSADGLSEEEGETVTRMVRKVPRRAEQLSRTDQEIVRLIGQHLANIGLKTSAEVLMQEAGCRLDQPTAALFKKHVMQGDWHLAVKSKRAPGTSLMKV